ncbi:hypothetical protein HDZ31DRAFT_63517 [Schizophyllum fasciatum]
MSTGRRHQRAPIVNPYEKFTQPDFDNWIGDLTGTLRSALGFEYKPERPQTHFQDSLYSNDSVASPDNAGDANEVADQLSDSELEEGAPKSSKAKGKERDPRERPTNGPLGGAVNPLSSDEDQASGASGSSSGEETEDSDAESQDVFQDGGEYDTDEREKAWLQRASSSKGPAVARSASRESVSDSLQKEDQEAEEADAATVLHSLSQVEEEEDAQPPEDDTSFPPPRVVDASSNRLGISARTPDIVDPWQGVEAYAEDYYKGGDRAVVKKLATSPSRLEEVEEDEDAVGGNAIIGAGSNVDTQTQKQPDSSAETPSYDREVAIRDPWDSALEYAEDLYTGGDASLVYPEAVQGADRIGTDDIDMFGPGANWETPANIPPEGQPDESPIHVEQLSPASPEQTNEDEILRISDEEVDALEDEGTAPPAFDVAPVPSLASQWKEYTGSNISSRTTSPAPEAQVPPLPASAQGASATVPSSQLDFSTPVASKSPSQAETHISAKAHQEELSGSTATFTAIAPQGEEVAPAPEETTADDTPPVADDGLVAQTMSAEEQLSLVLDSYPTTQPLEDVSPTTSQWQALGFDMSIEGVNTGDFLDYTDSYNDFSVDAPSEGFSTGEGDAQQSLAASHNIAELEAELGFHPSSPVVAAGPLRQEDIHILEVDDEDEVLPRGDNVPQESMAPPAEEPYAEAPPNVDDVDADEQIDLDAADSESGVPQQPTNGVSLPSTISIPEQEVVGHDAPSFAAPSAEQEPLPADTEDSGSKATEDQGAQSPKAEEQESRVTPPATSADHMIASPAPPMSTDVHLTTIPGLSLLPPDAYPASLSAPGVNDNTFNESFDDEEESLAGEVDGGEAPVKDADNADTDTSLGGQQDEPGPAMAPSSKEETTEVLFAHSQPDVELRSPKLDAANADTTDVEIADRRGEVVVVPEPVEGEPPSLAQAVAVEAAAPVVEAEGERRPKSPTPHPQPLEATDIDEVAAEDSIDGKTDVIDHPDAQTPGDMSTGGADSQADSIEQHGASSAKPSSLASASDPPPPAPEDLVPDADSHERGPSPEHTDTSPRSEAIPSAGEKRLPQKRARSVSSASSLTSSETEPVPLRKREHAPPRLRARPSRKVGLRAADRRAKRARHSPGDDDFVDGQEEEVDRRTVSPPLEKRPSRGKGRDKASSVASTSSASTAARMLEGPSSRASSADVAPAEQRQPSPPLASAPSPVAAAPIGTAWNMHHQHRKAAPTTMLQQLQRRMNGIPQPTPPPPPPKRASSVGSSSSAPHSAGSASSSSGASASAPPRRTKSAAKLAAAITTTRAVTRANCRYHKISIPREENQQRFFFLVPGCSLGNQEVMEDEEIHDHGIAAYEDGVRGIKDVEQLDLDPYVVGNLRKLTGVDILREGEVYYLPAEGETVRLLRARPLITARDYGNSSAAGSQPSSPLHQHYLGGPWRSPGKKPASGAESVSTVASGGGSILQRGRTATPSVADDEDEYVMTEEDELDEDEDAEDAAQKSPTAKLGVVARKAGEGGKGKQLLGVGGGKGADGSGKARRRSRRVDAAYKPGREEEEESTDDEEERERERRRRPRKSGKGGGRESGKAGGKGSGKAGLKRARTSEPPNMEDGEEGPAKSKRLRKSATQIG